jgi:H+/Cl- antiporter ClcA
MKIKSIDRLFAQTEQIPLIYFVIQWTLLASLIGILIGSASAFFLVSLDELTNLREENLWVVALLPIAGLIIGLAYYNYGADVVRGNNQILEEFHKPNQIIPFKMAPMVLFGTLITHLFGGSAGREGTAVQMGGAIADQFTRFFKLKSIDRKILIIIGISAGFASVFGTPLAGSIFALEVLIVGRIRYEAIYPSFLAAIVANYTCDAWKVHHTSYSIPFVPDMNPENLAWSILAGFIFGIVAMIFSKQTHFFTDTFQKIIKYPPLRPFFGGIIIALIVFAMGTTKYIGLGIPTIVYAFQNHVEPYDFLLKIIFTAFTLGAGFKGGEVTPLFFIGATLGNVLVWFIPLPIALLAGMGFVAVFSGATNTPIACTIMGIELFGIEAGLFLGIACVVAFLFSGHTGIYSSQIIGSPKHIIFEKLKSKTIRDVNTKE